MRRMRRWRRWRRWRFNVECFFSIIPLPWRSTPSFSAVISTADHRLGPPAPPLPPLPPLPPTTPLLPPTPAPPAPTTAPSDSIRRLLGGATPPGVSLIEGRDNYNMV